MMTPEQFSLLADLTRSRDPARHAAELVLVHGVASSIAAERAGIMRQSCSRVVSRIRRADALIREAYGR